MAKWINKKRMIKSKNLVPEHCQTPPFPRIPFQIATSQDAITALALWHHGYHRITTRVSRAEYIEGKDIPFLQKFTIHKASILKTLPIIHRFKHLKNLCLSIQMSRASLSNRHLTDKDEMSVRVGVIGCGRWGTTHLQTLADLKSSGKISEIHACDIISEKRLKIDHLVDTFSSSWQEMINQNELDIVAVVTLCREPLRNHDGTS